MNASIMKKFLYALLLACVALPLAMADEENGENGDEGKGGEEEKPKTIAELTEKAERIDGLFTLFRDPKTGATQMLIRADQLDREYIYFAQAANGVVQAGYFRGAYVGNGIVSVRRHFDRIEFVAENYSYWFDPDSALARAAEANISDAVLAVEKILAEDDESGDMLVQADKIFLGEQLLQVKFPPGDDADPKTTFTIGKLDDKKSKILNLRSYPKNTDVEVEYVYNDPAPKVAGKADITDSRNVSIRIMHSLIEMPDNDYRPRMSDPRIGFFDVQVTDLTSTSATPYRDLITRWNLVKKDPDAELSEPVEPITWWIENTTPVEWRDLIRDAALAWNSAFEKIGFRNAMVVKVQPDDADWDAGDIRYNVLRWTSSPNPPFGGYGPSFVNPRTGEIIGADVMLEFSFLNRYTRARWLLQDPAAAGREEVLLHNRNLVGHFCSLGQGLQANGILARTIIGTLDVPAGYSRELDEQLTHDTMHYLVLHELGHTLGMMHNMKATQYLAPDQAFDKEAVDELGLSASVMDYPAVNFAPSPADQTRFYAVRPGPYDDWFIEYGYSPALADGDAEAARLETILGRSTDPRLVFGNDADDMRSPGKAIDPRVNIYDMSSDAVTYASDRIDLLRDTLGNMLDKLPSDGTGYQEVYDGVVVLLREWGRSAGVVSRYVGGVYVDRAAPGQPGGQEPFRPVETARQRQAMEVLADQLFAPDAFDMPAALYRHAAQQRRGFDHFSTTEDPKIHDAVLALQKEVLDHLLHPVVLKRITDSALYGNGYSLSGVVTDLTDAIFEADMRGNVNAFRQNLQMEYVTRLAKMAKGNGGYHTPAASMAVFSLNGLRDDLQNKRGADRATQAHTQNLLLTIERALSVDG